MSVLPPEGENIVDAPSEGCDDEASQRAEELWWLLHHTDDQSRRTFTCYLDDSGSDDLAPVTIIGGCLLDKADFITMAAEWSRMLQSHRMDSLHMTDFVRPHGKHIGMFPEMKKALFTEAAKIIARRRKYSVCVRVATEDYRKIFPPEFSGLLLSPIAIAFIGAILLNAKTATDNRDYPNHIAYLVDKGNPRAERLFRGHSLITKLEERLGWKLTGSLTFEDDTRNAALQAADVIAWTARRCFSGDGLTDEFAPLTIIFEERFSGSGKLITPHFNYPVEGELLAKMKGMIERDRGVDIESDIRKVLMGGSVNDHKKKNKH